MQGDRKYITLFCTFTKRIIRPGNDSNKPLNESNCKYSFVQSNDNTTTITEEVEKLVAEQPCKHDKELMIGCAANCLEKFLELMLITMTKGEISWFKLQGNPLPCKPQTKLEKSENCNKIFEEKCFDVCLVLHDFSDAIPIWRLNPEKKYDLALFHKTKGTELFNKNDFEAAYFRYSTAIRYIIMISMGEQLDDELKDKRKQLKLILYFNLAACQLKFDNYENVIENCTKGLAIDTWNIKGLYRRAMAYKALGKVAEARSDLIKIIKRHPQNRAAGDMLESLMNFDSDNKNKDTDS